MTARVKILIEGHTNIDSLGDGDKEQTQPTVTLVQEDDLVMVVDPGILESQEVLVDALKKEGLTVEDVNMVFITHSHIDHYRNVGMFPKAKILEYGGIWDKTSVEPWAEDYTENLQILHTPGHDYTGISLFATTETGVVAICGDVFWRENYPADPHDDAYASNPEKLIDSRKLVLKKADFIIPGHAGMYKNNSKESAEEEISIEYIEPKIALRCKKCKREMKQKDKCQCRPFLCFRCCECALDCYVCSCSHRVF